jgi:hypothetical protein
MKIKLYKDFLNEELQKIISDQSGSGRTKYIDTIFNEPSSSKSPSSGILLRKQLRDQEFNDLKNILSDEIKGSFKKGKSRSSKEEKFKITLNNLKFLKDKAKEGELHCEYCGKGPLVIYDFNPENIDSIKISNPKFRFNTKFNEKDGATCDHREPVSKGGDKFDYSNLAVSCYSCNKRKGNLTYSDWLKRINESNSIEIDEDEIFDILVDIKNEFNLNLSVVKISPNEVQVIITGYVQKGIKEISNFTKELSDCIDRFNNMSYNTNLIQFGIDDKDFDSDGDITTLHNKFRVYVLFKVTD